MDFLPSIPEGAWGLVGGAAALGFRKAFEWIIARQKTNQSADELLQSGMLQMIDRLQEERAQAVNERTAMEAERDYLRQILFDIISSHEDLSFKDYDLSRPD